MPALSVRHVLASDTEALRALRLRALTDAPETFDTTLEQALAYPPEQWQARLDDALAGRQASVVVEDTTPGLVAMCHGVWRPDDVGAVEVVGMYVLPEHRGQGLPGRMCDLVEQWAEERGARRLRLGAYRENPGALRVYERLGFERFLETRPKDRRIVHLQRVIDRP